MPAHIHLPWLLLWFQLYGIKTFVVKSLLKFSTVKMNQLALILRVLNMSGKHLHRYVRAVCPLLNVASFHIFIPY